MKNLPIRTGFESATFGTSHPDRFTNNAIVPIHVQSLLPCMRFVKEQQKIDYATLIALPRQLLSGLIIQSL